MSSRSRMQAQVLRSSQAIRVEEETRKTLKKQASKSLAICPDETEAPAVELGWSASGLAYSNAGG